MRERTVGRSGLKVGDVGLGTLTWGRDTPVEDAARMASMLLDAGGTLIDTSPAFGAGVAEEVVGELLAGTVNRSDVILTSRAAFASRGGALRAEAGRGALIDSVHASLARLGTDYLDVLIVAHPDPLAPDEETAHALARLIDAGAVRYIGLQIDTALPGYPAWRVAAFAQMLAERRLPSLSAVAGEYSVLCRSFEESGADMAEHFGMGLLAYSPLGRGVLAGGYRHSIPPTSRAASEHFASFVEPYLREDPRRIVEAVAKAADGLGRTCADVALAWVLSRPYVACAVSGARTPAQLSALLEGVDDVPPLVIEAIDDVSRPRTDER